MEGSARLAPTSHGSQQVARRGLGRHVKKSLGAAVGKFFGYGVQLVTLALMAHTALTWQFLIAAAAAAALGKVFEVRIQNAIDTEQNRRLQAVERSLRDLRHQLPLRAEDRARPGQPHLQAPPSFQSAPPPYFQAPPPYFQAPPPYFQAPPPYFQAPPPYFQAPPSYFQAPPSYFEAPPPYFQAPSYFQTPPSYSQAAPPYSPPQPTQYQRGPQDSQPHGEPVSPLDESKAVQGSQAPLRQAVDVFRRQDAYLLQQIQAVIQEQQTILQHMQQEVQALVEKGEALRTLTRDWILQNSLTEPNGPTTRTFLHQFQDQFQPPLPDRQRER